MLRDGLEGRPKYSMASRHFLKESERSPGPAAYFPTTWALANRPPDYTFGMKHHADKLFITPGQPLYRVAISAVYAYNLSYSHRRNQRGPGGPSPPPPKDVEKICKTVQPVQQDLDKYMRESLMFINCEG